MRFDNWEAAARASVKRMAISAARKEELPGGRVLSVCMIKPLGGDPFYTYASCPGLPVRHLAVRAAACDAIREWSAF
jgi:hypothetical protein